MANVGRNVLMMLTSALCLPNIATSSFCFSEFLRFTLHPRWWKADIPVIPSSSIYICVWYNVFLSTSFDIKHFMPIQKKKIQNSPSEKLCYSLVAAFMLKVLFDAGSAAWCLSWECLMHHCCKVMYLVLSFWWIK